MDPSTATHGSQLLIILQAMAIKLHTSTSDEITKGMLISAYTLYVYAYKLWETLVFLT